MVSIPERSVPLPRAGVLDSAAEGAAIMDTGHDYPRRDGRIEPIESVMSESRWVASELGRPVIVAFSTIRAQDLPEGGKPPGMAGRIALPVAGETRPRRRS